MSPYTPLISVIIAVYNGEKYLNGAIESILQQSYKNYEIIIIDGGSTDSTVNIIDKHRKNIKYTICESDNGIYDAWNKGLKVATGAWISFLGSDDLFYPNAFHDYIAFISEHANRNNLEFVSSRIDLVDDNLATTETVGKAWDWQLFKRNMITWHVGCFHAKSLFCKYGLFDDTYKVSGDYELLLRPRDLLKSAYMPKTTVMMRDGGVSSTLLFKAIEETYRAKVKNKILRPLMGTILMYNNKMKLFIKMKLVQSGVLKKL